LAFFAMAARSSWEADGQEVDAEMEGDFAGASAMSQQEPTTNHTCQKCLVGYAQYSHLAYLLPQKNNAFAQAKDTTITKAVEKSDSAASSNKRDDDVVLLTCWKCCGDLHGVSYRHADGRLTSSWMNKAKASKRCNLSHAKLQRVLKTIDEKRVRQGRDEHMPSVEESFALLSSNPMARSATDFITVLVEGFMSLHYGCGACWAFPLTANGWWRCSSVFKDGCTFDGKGHWRCASCLERWTWGTFGHLRMLVIGTRDCHIFMMIGKATQDQENEINIIKGSQLLKTLHGEPVTKESLLRAIGALHDKARKHLMNFAEVRQVIAKDPSETGVTVVCEDSRLSLSRVGESVHALVVNGNEVPIAAPVDLDEVFATAGAFMTVDTYQPAGKSQKSTHWKFMEKVKRVRLQLAPR
jgi:hypothetical protein